MSAEGWILVVLRCGQLDKLDWSWRYHRCWAGLGWAGLGQRDSSNREQREECHEQLQPDPAPPRPAPQSAALTHFQQETSHGCSLNTAGDVTAQGRDQEMEECKVRVVRTCYTMQSQDTLKVVNLHCCCWTRWRGGAVWSLLSRPAFILQTAGRGVLDHSY